MEVEQTCLSTRMFYLKCINWERGEQMDSKFETLDIIHETQVSILRKIRDQENNRYLVVKEIKGMDHITKLLFDREINALKKLNNCKNIVKMYSYELEKSEEDGNVGRIFLEHIEGDNLAKVNLDLIEFRDKYGLIYQLVDAVESAHSHGIIHRDIKPENIMIEDYRNTKLIDFGTSKIKGMVTKGTVASFTSNLYTAPEVGYHNENATFQSDIYSLGATMFYLMTGREPCLPDKFAQEVLELHGINPKLKEIIYKAVRYNARDRYETITDLKRELDSIVQDLFLSSKFVISVPYSIFDLAKRKKFISENVVQNEFINNFLKKCFKNSYAFINSKLDNRTQLTQDDEVIFFGDPYKLLCTYNEDKEYFIVTGLSYVQPKVRNSLVNTYMKVNGLLNFYSATMDITSVEHNTYELATELIDHRISYESDENKQNEFDRFFGIWEDYLNNEKELLQLTAKKVNYKSILLDKANNIIKLELESTDIEELDFTTDTVMTFDSSISNTKHKSSTIITVGTFEEFTFEDNKSYLVLKTSKGFSSNKIPKNGCLVVKMIN